MKRNVLILTILFTATCLYAQNVMTLGQCIDRAITGNLLLQTKRTDIAKGKLGIKQSRDQLLPVIKASLGINDNLISPTTVTTGTLLDKDFPAEPTWQKVKSMQYGELASLDFLFPLYDRTKMAAIHLSEEISKLQFLSYDKVKEELIEQIGYVYYLAQSTLKHKQLTDENIERLQKLSQLVNMMYSKGTILEIDASRVTINVKNLQMTSKRYEILYESQLRMLIYLMNEDEQLSFNVSDMATSLKSVTFNEMNPSLPDISIAQQQKAVIQSRIKQVKAGYLPSISLMGNAGYLGFQDKAKRILQDNWFGNFVIGFRLNIPIFDANEKHHKIAQLRYDAANAQNQYELVKNRLHKELLDKESELDVSKVTYQTQCDNYQLALNVYNVTLEKYKEGVVSMTELLQDDISQRNAYTNCVDALYQYYIDRLSILKLTGQIEEIKND
jgi:outer membrane protein